MGWPGATEPTVPNWPRCRPSAPAFGLGRVPQRGARPPLVAEYRRLAETLGVAPLPIETGIDLQRAAAGLLRVA